jgi:hypothetical protein
MVRSLTAYAAPVSVLRLVLNRLRPSPKSTDVKRIAIDVLILLDATDGALLRNLIRIFLPKRALS